MGILLVVLGIAGAAWNFLAIRHDRQANPPPGHIYYVSGHAMHLYCTGMGAPTVVLEAGHGEDFTVWGKVQPALSRVARTCSYDRAGFGWSDAQLGERDAIHIADQLHALLMHADITAPVVLVGHSAGGLYAQVYASRYIKSVAGLVLVDAYTPNPLPEPPFSVALDSHSDAEFAWIKATVALGVARLIGQCDAIPAGMEAYAGWIKASACDYPQLDAYVREDRALGDSRREGAGIKSFGNMPLLILSQDTTRPIPTFLSGRITTKDWQQYAAAHGNEQAAYLKLSPRSRRVVAAGSGHYIHYDRPDVVIRETTALIGQIRSDATAAVADKR
ncbi:alpha/beta fold hydrolase [Dyella choica]|uniref:alpha/beta fold hydrolase n=1 Tax=Dyella choica TaxID=1927959 RepID=UPI0013153672|nr:alpha/beta hydrolase [Dyella choica]